MSCNLHPQVVSQYCCKAPIIAFAGSEADLAQRRRHSMPPCHSLLGRLSSWRSLGNVAGHGIAGLCKVIESPGAVGMESPGSLGTIGTIMRCNAAAGADDHDGCAKIAASAAPGPNAPAAGESILVCTSRKHHRCTCHVSGSAILPARVARASTYVKARWGCPCGLQDGRFHRLSSPHCICSV